MSVPNSFSAVTKAKSSQVNDNFDYITDLIDSTGSPHILATSGQAQINKTVSGTEYGLYMGADSNEPYIGSRTNHGLRIVTNSVKTAYFATDYSLRLFSSDASGTYAAIGSDASDNLYLLPGGTGLVNVVGTDLALRAGKAVRVYSPGDSNYSLIYNDSNDNLILIPNANGDVIVHGRMPRSNNGSATYVSSHIQRGWGYITGDGSASLSGNIVLPVAYSSSAWVLSISMCGLETGASAPTSEGGFSSGAPSSIYTSYYVVNSSQATINLSKTTGTFTSGDFYGYSWMAIGPV